LKWGKKIYVFLWTLWLFVTSGSPEEEVANACAALLRLILLFIAITPINDETNFETVKV
jgi:hypothetical protein